MNYPISINASFIEKHNNFLDLIHALKEAFATNSIITPARHHHDFPNSKMNADTTMLLMPSWQDGQDAGVKIVTVNPKNAQFDLPSIQGSYLYMNATNGTIKAIFDAKALTNKRTAAASALASSLLSRPDSSALLMIGTGALSKELIRAHCAIRPIDKIYVWGRNMDKAKSICDALSNEFKQINPVQNIADIISQVDIISAATMSVDPLILGDLLSAGQHIDLVGSYKPNMREADDATILRSNIYADVKAMAIKECGDLKIPLDTNIISTKEIKGDLFDLCSNKIPGRTSSHEITYFKSVGHALEDLIAARYYFKKYIHVTSL